MAAAPGAPTNLDAAQEAGIVTLTWNAPDDDGGSPILEYNILRGDAIEDLTVFNKVGTDTTFVDSSAERDKTFFYAVSARNNDGNGNISNIVSVDLPKKEDTGDDGAPWMIYAAVLVAIIVVVAIGLMMRGKRGGPESSATMKPDTEAEQHSTPMPTLVE